MSGAGPGESRRVVSGTLLQVVGRAFGSACAFATLALLSRAVSLEEFGRYTFYIGLFGVLDALADFGTGQASIGLTASRPWALGAVLARARRVRVVMGTLGVVATGAYAFGYGEPGAVWIVLAALYPITHALELSATVFKNRVAWRVPVAARAFASGARLGLVALLVALGVRHAPVLLFATALASSTANLLLFLGSRRAVAESSEVPAPADADDPAARLWSRAWPLGLGSLCAMLYFYVDGLFVRALEGDESLGLYNAAVRLFSFLIMAAQLASATALPVFVREHAGGDLARRLADLGQPLFLAACLGCGLGVPFTAPLLELAFGDEFGAAGPSLAWLLGAAAVVHAGAVFVTSLIAVGAVRAFLAIAASGLVLNVALNAWLVPARSIEGAAIATLATEAWVLVLSVLCLARAGARPLSVRPFLWLAGPALFAGGAWLAGLVGGP